MSTLSSMIPPNSQFEIESNSFKKFSSFKKKSGKNKFGETFLVSKFKFENPNKKKEEIQLPKNKEEPMIEIANRPLFLVKPEIENSKSQVETKPIPVKILNNEEVDSELVQKFNCFEEFIQKKRNSQSRTLLF